MKSRVMILSQKAFAIDGSSDPYSSVCILSGRGCRCAQIGLFSKCTLAKYWVRVL